MKKILMITVSVLLLITFIPNARAQEESKSKWNAGLDIYSNYIWRGLKFGTGAAFQPSVDFTAGGFTVGAWGSYSTGSEEAPETDLYATYVFNLGEKAALSFTVTDYYFPGTEYFNGDSHFIEPLVNLGLGNLSLTAAYMFYKNAANGSGDMYFQAGYTAGPVTLTLGGGNGQYSFEKEDDTEDNFAISNIGIGTSREIKITDNFSLPISGSVILNPSTEQLFVVVGISL
jgi:uncharacterized protein (TIGR02001 family)